MIDEQVRADFDRARVKAFLHDLVAALSRRPNDLIPYHEVRRRLSPERESYRGIQTVPLDRIVGSMDRFRDFDRAFLPRQRHTAGRWQSVDRAYYQDVTLPPIQLYQVGDVYFVRDGHHRVSVARVRDQPVIDAAVVEVLAQPPTRLASEAGPPWIEAPRITDALRNLCRRMAVVAGLTANRGRRLGLS